MGCGSSSVPAISEPSREAVNAGGRRKSYNTGGNLFPKSARNKERMTSLDEEDDNGNVSFQFIFSICRFCNKSTILFQGYQEENGHLTVAK